jgi:hypothetical protein
MITASFYKLFGGRKNPQFIALYSYIRSRGEIEKSRLADKV